MDDREFRRILGHFATGVAIVTAVESDVRVGATINSFSSLSLQPRLVLFSLQRSLRSLPVFERAARIGISILADDQRDISACFARAGADKWSAAPVLLGRSGAILIEGALAHLECERQSLVEGGDHTIVICRVLSAQAHHGDPLLYYQGGYIGGSASQAAS